MMAMWLRSMLYSPGNVARRVDKALDSDADAVILDLEDAVPQRSRSEARETVARAIDAHRDQRVVFVRTNPVRSADFEADLDAVVRPGLTGLKLPKTTGADEVREVDERLQVLEAQRGMAPQSVVILPTLETAAGVLEARAIASASDRVWSLSFGAEDYAASTGCETTPEGTEILYARSHVAACSAAAGLLPPIDTVYSHIDDLPGLYRSARAARALGFQGKSVIHPTQIAPVHEVFTPTAGQIAAAQRTIELAREAERRGIGAIREDGRLIDVAMVRRATALLGIAARLGVAP